MSTPALQPDQVVALHLRFAGGDMILRRREADGRQREVRLALAPERLARETFAGAMPSSIALENAIMLVEDSLATAQKIAGAASGVSVLQSDAPEFQQIASVAGLAQHLPLTLHRDAVEQVFSRLVAMIEGHPAERERLPADATFAAALLILRECLHHWGFTAIQLVPTAPAP